MNKKSILKAYTRPAARVLKTNPRRVLCASTTENFALKGLATWQQQQISEGWGNDWDATN